MLVLGFIFRQVIPTEFDDAAYQDEVGADSRIVTTHLGSYTGDRTQSCSEDSTTDASHGGPVQQLEPGSSSTMNILTKNTKNVEAAAQRTQTSQLQTQRTQTGAQPSKERQQPRSTHSTRKHNSALNVTQRSSNRFPRESSLPHVSFASDVTAPSDSTAIKASFGYNSPDQGRNMSNYCNYHVIIWPVFSQVQNKIITQNYSFETVFFCI